MTSLYTLHKHKAQVYHNLNVESKIIRILEDNIKYIFIPWKYLYNFKVKKKFLTQDWKKKKSVILED